MSKPKHGFGPATHLVEYHKRYAARLAAAAEIAEKKSQDESLSLHEADAQLRSAQTKRKQEVVHLKHAECAKEMSCGYTRLKKESARNIKQKDLEIKRLKSSLTRILRTILPKENSK